LGWHSGNNLLGPLGGMPKPSEFTVVVDVDKFGNGPPENNPAVQDLPGLENGRVYDYIYAEEVDEEDIEEDGGEEEGQAYNTRNVRGRGKPRKGERERNQNEKQSERQQDRDFQDKDRAFSKYEASSVYPAGSLGPVAKSYRGSKRCRTEITNHESDEDEQSVDSYNDDDEKAKVQEDTTPAATSSTSTTAMTGNVSQNQRKRRGRPPRGTGTGTFNAELNSEEQLIFTVPRGRGRPRINKDNNSSSNSNSNEISGLATAIAEVGDDEKIEEMMGMHDHNQLHIGTRRGLVGLKTKIFSLLDLHNSQICTTEALEQLPTEVLNLSSDANIMQLNSLLQMRQNIDNSLMLFLLGNDWKNDWRINKTQE